MALTLFFALTWAAQISTPTDPSAYRPDLPKQISPAQRHPKDIDGAAPPATAPVPTAQMANPTPMAHDAQLNLSCGGSGTANKATTANAYAWNNYGGSSQVTAWGQRSEGFSDQIDVRLFSGDDRIRLPRTMLPAIRGGADGWFKLKDVKVTDRAISASAAVNFINNPKIHIDRVTGVISINGRAGSYTGQCMAIEPDAKRKF